MTITFFETAGETNPLNGVVLYDKGELIELLRSFLGEIPFVCELVSDKGFRLYVGIGLLGWAEHSSCSGDPPFWLAVSPALALECQHVEFQMNGKIVRIPARNCLPFDLIIRIAGFFQQTGDPHPGIRWERGDVIGGAQLPPGATPLLL